MDIKISTSVIIQGTGIFLFPFETHCFVVYNNEVTKTRFIADGNDVFAKDADIAHRLRVLLKLPDVREVEYPSQKDIDHCSSSAVLIAIEFIRAHSTGLVPNILISPERFKNRLIKEMHPHQSAHVDSDRKSTFNKPLICKCGRKWRINKQKKYNRHLRMCPSNI